MRRRIGRLAMAMAMAIAVLGIPWASPATASPAIASPALASTYGGCSLTAARPVRLALYIHAWATLHCTGNVTPSSILIDLGYPTYFWSTSVMRQWYAVPANVKPVVWASVCLPRRHRRHKSHVELGCLSIHQIPAVR